MRRRALLRVPGIREKRVFVKTSLFHPGALEGEEATCNYIGYSSECAHQRVPA